MEKLSVKMQGKYNFYLVKGGKYTYMKVLFFFVMGKVIQLLSINLYSVSHKTFISLYVYILCIHIHTYEYT